MVYKGDINPFDGKQSENRLKVFHAGKFIHYKNSNKSEKNRQYRIPEAFSRIQKEIGFLRNQVHLINSFYTFIFSES